MILDNVNCPDDIKRLSDEQLGTLAGELRSTIIETVAHNGGHLASNLGIVELTIALHLALDCPRDKLIFDVGHQAYVHKLLTGRYKAFDTLRQAGGISGFPRTAESKYDAFSTGHASTAISAALGMARARDALGDDYRVVAVVGDGALTGGMCYEALNDLGVARTHMTVILNDNDMSIARNVGAMQGHLTRLRNSRVYRLTKARVRSRLSRLPGLGPALMRLLEVIKDALKKMLVRGSVFEMFGLDYYGPVDGHDITALRDALAYADNAERPVLLHVITKKGAGYAPAEDRPENYHSSAPFLIETGEKQPASKPGYAEVVADGLIELMRIDRRVVGVTAAMTSGTGLDQVMQAYPKRVYDVGIAEEHAITLSAGMASCGLKPFVCIYSTFLQRAYDQIIHDVALDAWPVCLLVDHAGVVGSDGATHQGIFDIAYLNTVPGLTIMAPRDADELRAMLRHALDMNAPCAIRYPKDADANVCGKIKTLDGGRWEVVRGGGETPDATALAVGCMVNEAIKAAETLKSMGYELRVINARFIKPLDMDVLSAISGEIITIEDGILSGGFGQSVLAALNGMNSGVTHVTMLGFDSTFLPHAARSAILHEAGLDADGIVKAVLTLNDKGGAA